MKKICKSIGYLAFSIASFSSVASDITPSFQLGTSLGQFNFKEVNGSYSVFGGGINAGYHFNSWIALEANFFSSQNLAHGNDELHASVFSLAPVFTYHINDILSVYGKVGVSSMNIKSMLDNGPNHSYSTNDWTYGFGLDTSITKSLTVRLGYETVTGETSYKISNTSDRYLTLQSSDTKISFISLGVTYHF
jgi:opacity protein-like surface antigen